MTSMYQHWIESIFTNSYHLDKVTPSRYLTLKQAATFLKLTEKQALQLMRKSKLLHAVEYNNRYYVHPHPVCRYVSIEYRDLIKRTLNSSHTEHVALRERRD